MTTICLCAGCRLCNDATPIARQGIIDLSATDLQNSDPIRLDGAWEFYWKQLLTPADFQGAHPPVVTAFLTLPSAWNHAEIEGEKAGRAGYATLRLRILSNREKQSLTRATAPFA
ncbi:MAG: hypothetical protein PHD01_14780 [Geobacteraceae bacterium]|nr:hypothetical protein [Geobacteraceae bacterium]